MINKGQVYTLNAENISEIAEAIENTLKNNKFSFSSVLVRNGKLVEHHLSTNFTNVRTYNNSSYIAIYLNSGTFLLNLGLLISFYPDGLTWSRSSESETQETRILLHFN